jgi:transcriptional regulator of acetoin/glycerol metabolism
MTAQVDIGLCDDATAGTLSHDDGGAPPAAAQTCAALYLCVECDRPRAGAARYALAGVDEVVIGRAAERGAALTDAAGRAVLRIGVPDARISSVHARLARREGVWVIEDAASKNGLLVDGRAVERAALTDGLRIEIGRTFFLFRSAVLFAPDGPRAVDAADLAALPAGTATLIPPLERHLAEALRLAAAPAPIMLRGESGTGKELIARALHRASGRRGAFVAVNCAALPPSLAASELFGYRKGAFSGADESRPGLIRAADGGTLFLDEVGDLPEPVQGLLLRALQEREVTPVGATQPVPVDLRVLSATHRDLEAMVERKELRGDLYARLAGGMVRLPPLRDRREDLGLLLAALLPTAAGEVRLAPRAARALLAHDWPLNVRELEKGLTAACALAGDGTIAPEHLPERLRAAAPAAAGAAPSDLRARLTGHDLDNRARLIELLHQTGGNVSAVARRLGKGRTQVQRWMKRYQLKA